MKNIILIDYGSGNIHSAHKALQKAAGNLSVNVSANPKDLKTASHIVLPGVGAFADCYKGVTEISGMLDEIKESIITKQKPFLGICVGMQLLAEKGFENGEHQGFGFLKGKVKKFPPLSLPSQAGGAGGGLGLKIPHMGWNDVSYKPNEPLFKNIEQNSDFYFVHSYYFDTSENIAATCDYGVNITASVRKDNIFGVQFHPEKSQANGLKLLENFVSL